jgi:hypothetical protein
MNSTIGIDIGKDTLVIHRLPDNPTSTLCDGFGPFGSMLSSMKQGLSVCRKVDSGEILVVARRDKI